MNIQIKIIRTFNKKKLLDLLWDLDVDWNITKKKLLTQILNRHVQYYANCYRNAMLAYGEDNRAFQMDMDRVLDDILEEIDDMLEMTDQS